ncbi:MAG: outer membrane beta-barrel protein [Acidobacteriota bacterium]
MRYKILFFLLFLPVLSFAQLKSFSFKLGLYTPYDLKTGMMYGMDYGIIVNEHVTFLLGADLYYKDISNESYLSSSEKLGVKIRSGQRMNEWTAWHFPLTGKVRVEFPLQDSKIYPYVVAGLGYGVTHISYGMYSNYSENPDESTLTYYGGVWQLGGGILYNLNKNADFLFEIMQNSASFEKDEGYNYFSTLNSSGVVFRAGIQFVFF